MGTSGVEGIGKTTAMKQVALTWAKDDNENLRKFDFLFYIDMKCIRSEKKLEEIIMERHAGLMRNNVEAGEIKNIIHGQREQVLILLDGYDEYTPVTNRYIEKAIRKQSLGNCCMVITSRETKELLAIRDYMDAKVEIMGFDEKKVKDYATKYLGEKSDEFMKIVRNTNIVTTNFFGDKDDFLRTKHYDYGILHIPFFLHMACVLFMDKALLPKTRTGIISEIVKRCPAWEQIRKTGQKNSKDFKPVAVKMGEFVLKRLIQEKKHHVYTKVKS